MQTLRISVGMSDALNNATEREKCLVVQVDDWTKGVQLHKKLSSNAAYVETVCLFVICK